MLFFVTDKLTPTIHEKCGTAYGYKLHYKRGENSCHDCNIARREQKNLWRKKNPDKVREHLYTWRDSHREAYRAIQRKAVAKRRTLTAGGISEPYTTEDVLDRWGTDCHICHEPIDLNVSRGLGMPGWKAGLHLDHVIPISGGGDDVLDNVKPSHAICNSSKSGRMPIESDESSTDEGETAPDPL
jgi:5-methylcytosine-specific restriction endonuclease McrA